jgi:hypothetical protein
MKRKSIPQLKKKAWDLLSQIIRRSHADEWGDVECYTCGKQMHWKPDPDRNLEGAQAGHAIPGRTGAVLLDDEIIRPQCFYCNIRLRGNYTIFTTKLIEENGMDWWKCKLTQSRILRKWSRVELEETIEKYKEKLKEFE